MRKITLLVIAAVIVLHATSQSSGANKFIDSFAKNNNFNGTILIDRESKQLYRKSFAFADMSFKIPNTPRTKYKIASITKAFTAVLVLQLVEQGKLDLDKPIVTYLPAYKGAGGNKVTIRHMLGMTAGMRNMDDNASSLEAVLKNGLMQYQLPFTSDQLLEKFCSDTLVREPGKEFDYNNADFIILGKIIEAATGKTFEQVLQEKILMPLKMKNSGMLSQTKIIDSLASTYFYRDDIKALVNDLPVYMENWYAAGAMYSTVDDISKFSRALFNGRLLKAATLKQMFTSGPGEYGFGVWVYNDYDINHRKYTIVKRPGSIMGAQAMLFHVLENDATIIILSNTGTVSLDDFAAKIAERVVR